ncbi:MAG: hypothetical protein AAGC55_04160, partial [Myxococcota bacterium]
TAALAAFADPGYDAYGWQHPERGEFREDKLTDLSSVRSVRRALAMADRFSSPKREEYLFLIRAYPIELWRRQRREALHRAVSMGIWVGPRLAQIAVSEGLARSRRDLIKILRANFAEFLASPAVSDLDRDAITDNRVALDREAATLGIGAASGEGRPRTPGRRSGGERSRSRSGRRLPTQLKPPPKPVQTPPQSAPAAAPTVIRAAPSAPPIPPQTAPTPTARVAVPELRPPTESTGRRDAVPSGERDAVVSGTIRENTSAIRIRHAARNLSLDELLARLDNPDTRVEAAVELANRGERRTIGPVMTAIERMNRTDAVHALGSLAAFGDRITPALIQGMSSSKSFVRQGSALTLAVLRNEEAIEALGDQLYSEPTAVWKEVARALGMAGPRAVMSVVSRLSEFDATTHERASWALAHLAVGGAARQVQQIAKGQNSIAARVAQRALELRGLAKKDDLNVRGRNMPEEQTVNRAFSRQFFRALEASAPVSSRVQEEPPAEMSSPALELDEADLLEAVELVEDDDAAEILDESDLLPT